MVQGRQEGEKVKSAFFAALDQIISTKERARPSVQRILQAGVHILGTFAAWITLVLLRKSEGECKTMEDYFNLISSFRFGPICIKAWQKKSEMLKFLEFMNKLKPKFILEIGTCDGGTLYLFSKAAPSNATIASIDVPPGPPFYGYSRWRERIYRAFGSGRTNIHLVRGSSHDRNTFERVKKLLRERKTSVEVLFIDGDHSYKGCREDFEMYSKLVKPGGIVAFHDILFFYPKPGVPEFWHEIKNKFKHFEIIENKNQGECGIGVLHM
jgi:predicted O-methyltransferase YrrM